MLYHVMDAPSEWANANEHTETTSTEALFQIDTWFKSGIPFFTQKSIRDVQNQLRKQLNRGEKILVKGLDGVTVAFEVRTGDDRKCHDKLTYQVGHPCIDYVSYQSLKARIESNRESPHLAFCNLRIQYKLTRHNIPTGESVLDFGLRSQDEVHRVFTTALQIWEESEVWAQIKATLSSTSAATNIRKIIGLGCGTMSLPDGIPHFSYGPAFQHALLLTTQRLLQEKCDDEIICGVQDPGYTDRDTPVLRSYGIKILQDPEGFLEIDDSSLVFACAPNVPVKQIVTDIARPAMLIWDRVDKEDLPGGVLLTDPDSARVREMISQSYDTVGFPHDEHFGDTVIYVRRESTAV
ncbi:hypothetical protein BDV12DRAFT_174676 [Aspergillus spectabilis]